MKAVPPMTPEEYEPVRKRFQFPEEGLLQKYYRRNPHALSTEVYDPADPSTRPLAFRFVGLQLKYMKEKNLSESEAYSRVERELKKDLRKESDLADALNSEEPHNADDVNLGAASDTNELEAISLREQFLEWTEAEEQFYESRAQTRTKE